MPVWHELTESWRASGLLYVVGIAQEQHAERCRLFAQWKELDWPILWDPFNLSGSQVVPRVLAVDEHGIVRMIDPRPDSFESDFLMVDFELPTEEDMPPAQVASVDPSQAGAREVEVALAGLLWHAGADIDAHVDTLCEWALANPTDAAGQFWAGVAVRMRYDSPTAHPDDFQRAIDFWTSAIALEPNQYIWRRRMQQYGPRMDKPYNFYTWIERASQDIRSRNGVPLELTIPLTPAELANPRLGFAMPQRVEPDPEARIERDERELIRVEPAVAFATKGAYRVASIHLSLRPDPERQAHWTNDAGPVEVWIGAGDLPPGWVLDERRLAIRPDGSEPSNELRILHCELELPIDAQPSELEGYVLYYVCESETGTCLYRRQNFTVPILPPVSETE